MSDIVRRTALGLLSWGLLLACAAADARAQYREEMDLSEVALAGASPESIIIGWPRYSYTQARLMLSKYGQPSEATDERLVWLENGPWKKTVVYRNPPGESVLGRDAGRLEQSIVYHVPKSRLAVLARFDREIGVDGEDGRITVLSNSENLNMLSLNLADEVIRGRRTPRGALIFRRRLLRLRNAGRDSRYLEGLLFVRGGAAANPESPD